MLDTAAQFLTDHYNWQAALLSLGLIILITKIGKWLLFRVPALAQARELNREADKQKWAQSKYPPVVRANRKVGLACNAFLFLVVLPLVIVDAPQLWWEIALDVFIVLMFYDFLYYLSHRFWFHGKGAMRQVHALHHQARKPTHLDAHYVHPLETFVGLSLYIGSIAVLAPLLGGLHLATIVITFVLFTQINTMNHTRIELDYFPFKTATWITRKHHIHHIDMHKGNYATITLLYDRLFGTLD